MPDQLAAAGSRFGFGALFTDARDRAQAVLDALWQDPPYPPHLVHGDLTPQNVIMSPRHGLVPIDFQDTVLGFEVQDLSITISALRRRPGGDRLVQQPERMIDRGAGHPVRVVRHFPACLIVGMVAAGC